MDQALRDMKEAEEQADLLELRLDFMQHPDLPRLLRYATLPTIVTVRTQDQGGYYTGDEDKRISLLEEAIFLGADFIDIEFNHLHRFSLRQTKMIVSYHNFMLTPSNLSDIYHGIASQSSESIVKISTYAETLQDSVNMLQFLIQTEGSMIGICMGTLGIMTRVYGPFFGSYLTYACLEHDKASAPGQMTAKELRETWKLLQLEHRL